MAPPANQKKRVKVYELRDNDWYDRGTGFCTGRVVNVEGNVSPYFPGDWVPSRLACSQRVSQKCPLIGPQDEPRIYVESEEQPDRLLLETKIGKDDGYQKQQGNLASLQESTLVKC